MVELRVVEAVQELHGARPRGRYAYAHLARELGVRAGREAADHLVAHLDELGLAVELLERAHEAVDAVARVAVHAPDAPLLGEAAEHELGDGLAHAFAA